MKYYQKVLILIVIALAVVYAVPKKSRQVTDFQSCKEAGYPLLETYPEQCKTPDGRTFMEEAYDNPEVIISSPKQGQLVASPLTVTGKARGFWFFEANLPATLKDQNGKILVRKGLTAKGNWMTEDYVEFEGTLEFPKPETEFGVLIIEKDNPSGDPQFDASYAIPVRFK